MYYYLVMTNPAKEWCNIEDLHKYCKSSFSKSILVGEMGDNGTNPHMNCIVLMGTKRIDNVRRGILTAYYGSKYLDEFEKNSYWCKYGAVGKTIKDLPNLKNTLNYIKKEDQHNEGKLPWHYEEGINMYELTEGMLSYKEHHALQEGSCSYARTAEQLLCEMIMEYKKECMDETLNQFIVGYKCPTPVKSDFVNQLKKLAFKGYNLTPITSKMKIYYIEFMSRLGNYDQFENLIDRIDEELTRSRN